MGMGGGGGSSTSTSKLYNWKDILPPWVQAGQQMVLPQLISRAATGGMTPMEERNLWGQARGAIEDSSMGAGRNLARKLATSGISASSPAAAGGYADLAADRMTTTSKAALDFAKLKMGAKDTAIGQMLTALYTPPPVAVGTSSQSTQSGGK